MGETETAEGLDPFQIQADASLVGMRKLHWRRTEAWLRSGERTIGRFRIEFPSPLRPVWIAETAGASWSFGRPGVFSTTVVVRAGDDPFELGRFEPVRARLFGLALPRVGDRLGGLRLRDGRNYHWINASRWKTGYRIEEAGGLALAHVRAAGDLRGAVATFTPTPESRGRPDLPLLVMLSFYLTLHDYQNL